MVNLPTKFEVRIASPITEIYNVLQNAQEAQLSLRDRATRASQLKSWQLLNDYTICLTNTDHVSVSASRLTLKSIHIAETEVNYTDKLARL